jgi:putative DNA methylase
MTYRKKLIEVSLPLEAINEESAREKSIRHGHPSTLHLWWARRPLAACRAVLWSSLVDDPSEYMPDEESANNERERLFAILEKLVLWSNVNNEEVFDDAKLEIARSVAREIGCDVPVGKKAIREFLATKAPPVLDPFAGGGSIPLEAQRLGLQAYASDLNPVSVLINKALIEIPTKYSGASPIHPLEQGQKQGTFFTKECEGAEGLAEDVRYYGKWMRDEAEKQIGNLYPKVKITPELLKTNEGLCKQGLKIGDELTVIAWLWARSVKCPNPACGCQMPLVRSFALSTKKSNPVWIDPIIDQSVTPPIIHFRVKTGIGKPPSGTVIRTGARCICCDTPVAFEYIREEGKLGRMGAKMMAIICEGPKTRLYLEPTEEHEAIAISAKPRWKPETCLPEKALGFRIQLYGMTQHSDLFTPRQLVSMTTFSDLVDGARALAYKHSIDSKIKDPESYANSIATYLGITVSRLANRLSSNCFWDTGGGKIQQVFARQALPMVWDYVEANPFSDSSGNWIGQLLFPIESIEYAPTKSPAGIVEQQDATRISSSIPKYLISTDPPYYDNIGYADLSDFFYIWLRSSLSKYYPELFATMLVPKSQELIATPFRFNGDKVKAETFFENGLRQVFANMRRISKGEFPITVFYAFKQSENDDESNFDDEPNAGTARASTGWETMLEGLVNSNLEITGTWPIRTEFERGLKNSVNALASSIVLVCRPRSEDASTTTRRDFLSALKRELPHALRQLQLGNIAPVDLAQAAIGPGMAIFSRYKSILEADGSPMRVRAALTLINQALDEYLAEQEGIYDGDTRWALAWFEQYGHEQGPYGVAETLSKAKNTSVEGLSHAGFLEARAGKVRLMRRDELSDEWDPTKDKRLTAWEAVQYLIRTLDKEGEKGAGALLGKLGAIGETARDLAYRLYTICERKGWAQEALAYNMLVVAWPRIKEQSGKGPRQESLL